LPDMLKLSEALRQTPKPIANVKSTLWKKYAVWYSGYTWFPFL